MKRRGFKTREDEIRHFAGIVKNLAESANVYQRVLGVISVATLADNSMRTTVEGGLSTLYMTLITVSDNLMEMAKEEECDKVAAE